MNKSKFGYVTRSTGNRSKGGHMKKTAVAVGLALLTTTAFSGLLGGLAKRGIRAGEHYIANAGNGDIFIRSLKACHNDNGAGCFNIGLLILQGKVPNEQIFREYDGNATMAASYYKRACDLGDMDGCHNLSVLYYEGKGVEKDIGKEFEYRKKACEGGKAISCHRVAEMYEEGLGVPEDRAMSMKYDLMGCEGGIADICLVLGMKYEIKYLTDEDPNTRDKTLEIFRKGCSLKGGASCYHAGKFSIDAFKEPDYSQAMTFYKKACDLGESRGCTALDDLYAQGHTINKRYEGFAKKLAKECRDGDGRACYNLGAVYAKDIGDYKAKLVRKYYEKACDLGDGQGCFNLGTMNQSTGEREIAAKYYQKACELGNKPGCAIAKTMGKTLGPLGPNKGFAHRTPLP